MTHHHHTHHPTTATPQSTYPTPTPTPTPTPHNLTPPHPHSTPHTHTIVVFLDVRGHIHVPFNTLRPRQNHHHFADDIFKNIFFDENVWILIIMPLKFLPKGPINNIPALVKMVTWRQAGDKPLSEPMMARLSTHFCVTRPQWEEISTN